MGFNSVFKGLNYLHLGVCGKIR